MSNIKTVIHTYHFDTSKSQQQAEYAKLLRKLSAGKFPCCEVDVRYSSYTPDIARRNELIDSIQSLDGQTIELETKCLFDNQWNTAPVPGCPSGFRAFNWAEYTFANPDIKQGYWLEQTAEMTEILRNTYKCGYCGAQEPAAKGYVFCPHCLDSQYLTSDKLFLTRMRPVSKDRLPRAQLTDAEREHLLPLFREAQINGQTERGKARIAKLREDLQLDYERTIENARIKRDGYLWCLDHAISTDNVIYYKHTGRFRFGWRHPVDDVLLSTLLDAISEFPFPYDIDTQDGRTLSGG